MDWQCFQCSLSGHAIILEVCTSNAHEIIHLRSLSTLFIIVVNDGTKWANLTLIFANALVEHLVLFFVLFVIGVLVAMGCRH